MSDGVGDNRSGIFAVRLFVRAFCTLVAIRLSMFAMPFAQVRSIIECANPRTVWRHRPSPDEIASSVMRASAGVPGLRNCLCRALATKRILNRFGYRSELKIGARKTVDRAFHAHAWVESAGKVLVGNLPELDEFAVMSGTAATQGASSESSR